MRLKDGCWHGCRKRSTGSSNPAQRFQTESRFVDFSRAAGGRVNAAWATFKRKQTQTVRGSHTQNMFKHSRDIPSNPRKDQIPEKSTNSCPQTSWEACLRFFVVWLFCFLCRFHARACKHRSIPNCSCKAVFKLFSWLRMSKTAVCTRKTSDGLRARLSLKPVLRHSKVFKNEGLTAHEPTQTTQCAWSQAQQAGGLQACTQRSVCFLCVCTTITTNSKHSLLHARRSHFNTHGFQV